jgi:hypothetical protein
MHRQLKAMIRHQVAQLMVRQHGPESSKIVVSISFMERSGGLRCSSRIRLSEVADGSFAYVGSDIYCTP